MAFINFQPRPHVPPIGFFQPISVDPKDMMTDVEFLLGVIKKLNQLIAQVNKNTEQIDKVAEIEEEIIALRAEMSQFEIEVNQKIALEFAEIKVELQSMIATALAQANAYTDVVASRLEDEIQEISVGQISLFDPTTGLYSPLQVVVDNLYNLGRTDALTASEYDALDLTATQYDAFELTAYMYDNNGKTLLEEPVSA
ncbi:MAG: hypothetical protein J6S67_11625 [Methanobrevibacter sp.]|nr:hypothetical protein [Methanobrevibacter sp.]